MNKCPKCGLETDGKFCPECGSLTAPMQEPMRQPAPDPIPRPNPTYSAPVIINNTGSTSIPEEYKPISAWGYFGYTLLFAIPIVGFIFLIIFSCKKTNINRRNYARSYWCALIVAAAIILLVVIIALIAGVSFSGIFKSGGWRYY